MGVKITGSPPRESTRVGDISGLARGSTETERADVNY